ncbi:hypothetical protein DFH09DRAFT_1288117 [Mycena vulgaris]|nr:hypothetical protein DFH09DRAFT_1288117 [Mycena vulgaris]
MKDFRDAPEEQQKLFAELDNLKPLLCELQKRVSAIPGSDTLQQMSGPLNKFQASMESFLEKLRPGLDGPRSKLSQRLAWTLWSKKEAKGYLDEFERIKVFLNVWLTVDIWDIGQKLSRDQDGVRLRSPFEVHQKLIDPRDGMGIQFWANFVVPGNSNWITAGAGRPFSLTSLSRW